MTYDICIAMSTAELFTITKQGRNLSILMNKFIKCDHVHNGIFLVKKE